MKLGKSVVIGIGSMNRVSDALNSLLIDSSLEECLPDVPGVEGVASTPGIRISASRLSAEVLRSETVRTVSGWYRNCTTPIQTPPNNLTSPVLINC